MEILEFIVFMLPSYSCGEGGILVSKDKKLIKLAQRYVKYDRFEQNMSIGINFRVSEMQALLIFSAIKNYKNNKK